MIVNNRRLRRILVKHKTQNGSALIVGLIVLAVVTVIGVSSMQSANTELKLAASLQDREIAFQAAEAALAEIGKDLITNSPPISTLIEDCTGSDPSHPCFNPLCDNGLCFSGKFTSADDQIYCQATDFSGVSRGVEFWSDSGLNVWSDSGKHKTLTIDGVTTPVKYITEFRCFVPKHAEIPFTVKDGERNNGAPSFRVTVVAQGNGKRSTVALQSTYTIFD